MKCSKTYVIKGKRINVHWCGIGLLVLGIIVFVVAEQKYGPF